MNVAGIAGAIGSIAFLIAVTAWLVEAIVLNKAIQSAVYSPIVTIGWLVTAWIVAEEMGWIVK